MSIHCQIQAKLLQGAAVAALLAAPFRVAAAPQAPFPTGADVQLGAPTIHAPDGSTQRIGINDARTIINWATFDIDAANTVLFQAEASGLTNYSVLNRVTGGLAQPSEILGALKTANQDGVKGTIWLINPNGVLFGPSSVVDVSGLIVSSLDISNQLFENQPVDGFHFQGGGSAGAIVVKAGAGDFAARDGALLLVAPRIETERAMLAGGSAGFVVATDTKVRLNETSIIGVTISAGTPIGVDAADIQGAVTGKDVFIAGASSSDITGALLNVTGPLVATGLEVTDRGIVLSAGRDATGVTIASANDAGIVLGGDITSAGAIDIRATSDVTTAKLRSTGNLMVDGGGDVNLASVRADGSINLAAGGILDIDLRPQIGGDYTVRAQSFAGSVLNPDFGLGTSNNFSITDTHGGLSLGAISVPGGLSVTVENGDLIVAGLLRATAGNIEIATPGGVTRLGANLTAGDDIDLRNSVVLTADSRLTAANARIDGTVEAATSGSAGLTIAGDAWIAASLGAGAALKSLTVEGAAHIGSDIRAVNSVAFEDKVVLLADSRIAATSVWFKGAVDGSESGLQRLDVIGSARFDDQVGATALRALTVSAGTRIGSVITAAEEVTFGGAVTLHGDSSISGSHVWFKGALDGSSAGTRRLTVNGSARFDGVVGATALNALTVNGDAQLGANITAANDVLFEGALVLAANSRITADNVWFKDAVSGTTAGLEQLDIAANARFDGIVGATALSAISVTGTSRIGTDITVTDTATFNGSVVLSDDSRITANNVWFKSSVNGATTGGEQLSIIGDVRFDGNVGLSTALQSISIQGNSRIGAGIGATGAVTFDGAVVLNNNVRITAEHTWFKGAVNASASGLERLEVNGGARFDGLVGATALHSLTVNGDAFIGSNVNANNGATFNGDVILTNDSRITANSVSFTGAVDGSAVGTEKLEIVGNARFQGDVGRTTLESLTVSGTTHIGGNIAVMNGAIFSGAVTLTGDSRVSGAYAEFGGTINGAHDLEVEATGAATFAGAIGGSTRLSNFRAEADRIELVSARTSGNLSLEAVTTVNATGSLTVGGNYSVTAAEFLGTTLEPILAGATSGFSIVDVAGGLTVPVLTAPGDISVTVRDGVLVASTITSSHGNVSLITSRTPEGVSGDIILGGDIATGSTGTLTLTSVGNITQAGGRIRAARLQGGALGAATIANNANEVAAFGEFNSNGLTFYNNRSLTVDGEIRSGLGAILIDAIGTLNITAPVTSAGGAINLRASGDIVTSGDLTSGAGFDIDVLSSGGSATVGSASSGASLSISASHGSASLGTGGAALDIDVLGKDVAITDAAAAGDDIRLIASTGTVAGRNLSANGSGTDTEAGNDAGGLAGANIIVQAPGNVGLSGSAIAGRDIKVTTSVTANVGDITAGRDLSLVGSAVTGGALASGRHSDVRASGGDLVLQSALADGSLQLTAANNMVINGWGTAARGNAVAIGAGRDVSAAGNVVAAGPLQITAQRTMTLGGIHSTNGSVRLVAQTGGIYAGSLHAGSFAELTAAVDAVIDGPAAAGGDLAILANGGRISLGDASAGGNATLKARSDVFTGRLSGATVDIEADSGRISLSAVEASGQVDLRAANDIDVGGAVQSGGAFLADAAGGHIHLGAITANGNVALTAGGDIRIDGLARVTNASDDLLAESRFGAVRFGAIDVSRGVRITASKDISVAGLVEARGGAAAGDILLETAGASVRLGGASTNGRLIVTSGGDVAVDGPVIAGALYKIQANGQITLGSAEGATQRAGRIVLSSSDINLGNATKLVGAEAVELNVAGSGAGLALGDFSSSIPGSYSLSKSELARIETANLVIDADFGGAGSGLGRNVVIGDAAVAATNFTLKARGDVNVIDRLSMQSSGGNLVIGGDGATTGAESIRISTHPDAARNSGVAGRIEAPGSTVSLRAKYIVMGQGAGGSASDFIGNILHGSGGRPLSKSEVRARFFADGQSPLYQAVPHYVPSPQGGPPIFINAANLHLTVGEYALVQNTGPSTMQAGGIDVGKLRISKLTAADPLVAVFGKIGGQGGQLGASNPGNFALDDVGGENLRVNGCVAMQASGCISTVPTVPRIEVIDPLGVILMHSAPDMALPVETITGSTNEALWREEEYAQVSEAEAD